MLPPKSSGLLLRMDRTQDCMYSGFPGPIAPQQYTRPDDIAIATPEYSTGSNSSHHRQLSNMVTTQRYISSNNKHSIPSAQLAAEDDFIAYSSTMATGSSLRTEVHADPDLVQNKNLIGQQCWRSPPKPPAVSDAGLSPLATRPLMAATATKTDASINECDYYYTECCYGNGCRNLLEEERDSIDREMEEDEDGEEDEGDDEGLEEDRSPSHGIQVKDTECCKVKAKSYYKHIPHKDKPPHLVAKRNARERRRVQAVNSAFGRLRKHIPYPNKNKRLSKVKTLKVAIDYIHQLQDLIEDYDHSVLGGRHKTMYSVTPQQQNYTKDWHQLTQNYNTFDPSFTYCSTGV